jgi:4-hydroxy-tetrahydrodipicolinate synthase
MPPVSTYAPHGVIPAVLLSFDNDLSIDETSFRKHLRDVSATPGISAITFNAHSREVASCTFDEQRRVFDIAQHEVGERIRIFNGIWADSSLEAARIARMATQGGASALLVFPPGPFTLGQSQEMALAHFRMQSSHLLLCTNDFRNGSKSRHRSAPGRTCIDPSKTFGASAFGATAHPF